MGCCRDKALCCIWNIPIWDRFFHHCMSHFLACSLLPRWSCSDHTDGGLQTIPGSARGLNLAPVLHLCARPGAPLTWECLFGLSSRRQFPLVGEACPCESRGYIPLEMSNLEGCSETRLIGEPACLKFPGFRQARPRVSEGQRFPGSANPIVRSC